MTPVIFLGPSLARSDAEALLPADYRPPVRQGDVYRAVRGGAGLIGIVDGYFHDVPSVWHKEILFALHEGVAVLGAASMGALRAAELHPFGMEGVGEIFQAFRDGRLTDDDEVAVQHGPAELGYPALSEAMVNIRATLAAAERAGVIDTALRAELEAAGKALFYPERSWGALLAAASTRGLPTAPLTALEAWLPANRVNQKRNDALALLEAVRERLLQPPRPAPSFRFEVTELWQRFVEQEAPPR
jgi:hypothetical protein